MDSGGALHISNAEDALVGIFGPIEDGIMLGVGTGEGTLAAALSATEGIGSIEVFNSKGNPIHIGETSAGHGGIWVYDRHLKNYKLYGHK